MEAANKIAIQDNMTLQVDLPIGLPPKHYGVLYQKFENYFRDRGGQNFTYKDRQYEIEINKVVAFPQDYAAAMTIFPQIKEYNKVITADIGGFTLDYLLIRSGKPDLSVCDSLVVQQIRSSNFMHFILTRFKGR